MFKSLKMSTIASSIRCPTPAPCRTSEIDGDAAQSVGSSYVDADCGSDGVLYSSERHDGDSALMFLFRSFERLIDVSHLFPKSSKFNEIGTLITWY